MTLLREIHLCDHPYPYSDMKLWLALSYMKRFGLGRASPLASSLMCAIRADAKVARDGVVHSILQCMAIHALRKHDAMRINHLSSPLFLKNTVRLREIKYFIIYQLINQCVVQSEISEQNSSSVVTR